MSVNVLTESERNAVDLMGSNLSHEDLQVIDGLCKLGSKRHPHLPDASHPDQTSSSSAASSSSSPSSTSMTVGPLRDEGNATSFHIEAHYDHPSAPLSLSGSAAPPPHKMQKLSSLEGSNTDAFSSGNQQHHQQQKHPDGFPRQRSSSFDLRDALNPVEHATPPRETHPHSHGFSIENITTSSGSIPSSLSSPPPFASYSPPDPHNSALKYTDFLEASKLGGKGTAAGLLSLAGASAGKKSVRQIAIAPRQGETGTASSPSATKGSAGRSNPRLSDSTGLRLPALLLDPKKDKHLGDRTPEEFAAESSLASMIDDDHPKASLLNLQQQLHKTSPSSSSSSAHPHSHPLPHMLPSHQLFQQFQFSPGSANQGGGASTGKSASGGMITTMSPMDGTTPDKPKAPKASQASSIPYQTDDYISFNKVTQHLIDNDVEALGYILVYVRTGGLPGSGSSNVGVGGKQPKYWCGVPRHNHEERWFKWANVVSLFPAGMEVNCEIDSVNGTSDWLQGCADSEIKRQRLVSKSIPASALDSKGRGAETNDKGVPVREFYQVERTVKFTGKPGHSKAEGKRKMKTLKFSLVLNISSQSQSAPFPPISFMAPEAFGEPESRQRSVTTQPSSPSVKPLSSSSSSSSLATTPFSPASLRATLSTSTAEVPLPVEIPPMERLKNPVVFGATDLDSFPEKRVSNLVVIPSSHSIPLPHSHFLPSPLHHTSSGSGSGSGSGSLSSSAPVPLTPISPSPVGKSVKNDSRSSSLSPSSTRVGSKGSATGSTSSPSSSATAAIGQMEMPSPFVLPSMLLSESNIAKKLKDISDNLKNPPSSLPLSSSSSPSSSSSSRDHLPPIFSSPPPPTGPKFQGMVMTCERFEFPPVQDTKMTIVECMARYTAPGSGTRTSPERSFLRSTPQAIRVYKDPITNHLRWQTVSFKELGLAKNPAVSLSSSGGHSFSTSSSSSPSPSSTASSFPFDHEGSRPSPSRPSS